MLNHLYIDVIMFNVICLSFSMCVYVAYVNYKLYQFGYERADLLKIGRVSSCRTSLHKQRLRSRDQRYELTPLRMLGYTILLYFRSMYYPYKIYKGIILTNNRESSCWTFLHKQRRLRSRDRRHELTPLRKVRYHIRMVNSTVHIGDMIPFIKNKRTLCMVLGSDTPRGNNRSIIKDVSKLKYNES